MKKLNFYFDFLSPFSFFAFANHEKKLPEDIKLNYRPLLMGKLFSHFGFPGPGDIPVKRNYELKKCFRYAAQNNIEFHPPEQFPFNPLGIIRLATDFASGTQQKEVIQCIFSSIWQKGLVLEDPELIEKCLIESQLDPAILERSFAKESKLELKNNLKDAINQGIFGVPSFQVDQEFFWGNDSFDSLNKYLSGNDNWNMSLYNDLIKE